MDKRELAHIFQERLKILLARVGTSQSAFAALVGIDRSAMSQLLDGQSTRLPRVETLLNIAERCAVSLDWLVGVSHDEGITGEMKPSFEVEEGDAEGRGLLSKWHAEASGSKIRYVPQRLPDIVRIEQVIAYETDFIRHNYEMKFSGTTFPLDFNRKPGTDMEICMPIETLEDFARGNGIWKSLSKDIRTEQLNQMATVLDELYPSLRLFLFDGRRGFSIPYTVFGQLRAAIFLGEMYLVLNAPDSVLSMQRHFDRLVRIASINPHEASRFVSQLSVE
ncbi:helix-turn-helix domain-containing protein [Rhizobium lusitanum]|uniref:helix-turn-helix domain-containing protein n=1 Tax=Rhizobium lusitanum TaxID=293958 RepID=UPI00195D37A5|nr:helix-turn-helix domain-containing protein [Rhizobium lusitanum]MBM7044004.1 helix-turn-helix transcriptional regulator [Rhizobium lusitanum]